MLASPQNEQTDTPAGARLAARLGAAHSPSSEKSRRTPPPCFHCGQNCVQPEAGPEGKIFCCPGCKLVHELLAENGLGQFYQFRPHPGVRVQKNGDPAPWRFLDNPELQRRLLDFTDGKTSRITLRIPAIHCIACVWLLESLFRLHPGIGLSRVNFPRREVAVSYYPGKIALSELVALLVSLGYEPDLTLGELERRREVSPRRRLWLQVGIAGFAFGNIMLFSLPGYMGLDSFSGPLFRSVFGWLSLALALPVVVYSAGDYWRSAWASFRRKALTLDVPIALGLAALYLQSAFEIGFHRGEGYLDSLAGLVFFLLCGRIFQQRTFERLEFDRDYKCFFPLSVTRIKSRPADAGSPGEADGQERVAISEVRVGDRLLLRNGELIPADTELCSPAALIDYSFVTGESEPVPKSRGDHLYAGGRQIGGAVELITVKPVSQSYLTSLWNHEAFRKDKAGERSLNSQTNLYSRRFTRIVIGVALAAALFWVAAGQPGRGVKAFASVLIVACPCALALAAPFALGTGQRLLARYQVFLRNADVLERMAQVNSIVFDKTGTLTATRDKHVAFVDPGGRVWGPAAAEGASSLAESPLKADERWAVWQLAAGSTHPHAARIAGVMAPDCASFLKPAGASPEPGRTSDSGGGPLSGRVEQFEEIPGRGLRGVVGGCRFCLGSRAWLEEQRVALPPVPLPSGSAVWLAIGSQFRGVFVLANRLRPAAERALATMADRYELTLLSGDNASEQDRFRALFGPGARLEFDRTPLQKLEKIRERQRAGRVVMMVGDGLNDSGALRQSDVGVAVVEEVGMFSPASDAIMPADFVSGVPALLSFARRVVAVIRISFGISAVYNLGGVAIAAAGVLSPLICAVLMPLSSVSVVLFASGATAWVAGRAGFVPERAPDGAAQDA